MFQTFFYIPMAGAEPNFTTSDHVTSLSEAQCSTFYRSDHTPYLGNYKYAYAMEQEFSKLGGAFTNVDRSVSTGQPSSMRTIGNTGFGTRRPGCRSDLCFYCLCDWPVPQPLWGPSFVKVMLPTPFSEGCDEEEDE